MPGVIVDGFDFFAVHEAAGEAIERARAGGGPTLIEVKLTRYYGHFEGDQQTYRAGEVANARENLDCLKRFRARVIETGQLDESSSDAIDAEVAKLIEDSVSEAKAAPKPTSPTCSPTSTSRTEEETMPHDQLPPGDQRGARAGDGARRVGHRHGRGHRRRRRRPGEDDAWGGVLGVTKGLYRKFPGRVLDTPISESAFVGAAVGAATAGLRPVAELMFVDFMGVCFDQIFNQAAKFRYMFGGKAVTPVVIRTMYGAGLRAAAQHSQCLYPIFTHIPGLKVVVPSNPYEAKGLLIQAIRDDDPVIFFEHKALYDTTGEVPEESYTIPFGEANVVREGDDVTIVAFGRMVAVAEEAARELAATGIEAEIIDPRTTSPLDTETILESVEDTGRLVVVDEASPRCNLATDISALAAKEAFGSLQAPIEMVTPPHTPVPFSDALEDLYIPDAQKVLNAAKAVVEYKR